MIFMLASLVSSAACRRSTRSGSTENPPPAASPVERSAFRAGRLASPLSRLTKDELATALARGGWRVTMASEVSTDGKRTILAGATKVGTSVTVTVYVPADEFWELELEKQRGAYEKQDGALIGVVMADKPVEARVVLDSLLGR